MEKNSRILVAGHTGLVGSALMRRLEKLGYKNVTGVSSSDVDLTNAASVKDYFSDLKPEVVFMAAGKVGGILANSQYPVDFLAKNVSMMVNVFEAANMNNVEQLLYLGSSCIYPKFATQPISEESLLTGPLEDTNKAYAISKIAGVIHVQGYRQQYGRKWISGMPTNLYGPNDNFDLNSSHVLPAMIRKFHEAASSGQENVTLWGTGSPMREFMHVDDLADACIFALNNYNSDLPLNLGTGKDISIKELAETISRVVGFNGSIKWDSTKPDGTPRKLLDTSVINNLGWESQILLEDGIRSTYAWYQENYP